MGGKTSKLGSFFTEPPKVGWASWPAKVVQAKIGNAPRHRMGWQASKLAHHFSNFFPFFVIFLFWIYLFGCSH